jgi:ABC-2 type transport system permease protein
VPIHDQGYRRYTGTRLQPGRAWSVIARTGVRALLAKRAFIGLMLLAWLPFVVRAVQIYAAANLPQAQFLAPDARMFRQFLEQQDIFLFFITVYVGTGLIANDRRANALQIYLSKPLTRVEYIFGKFAILLTILLLVTCIPALLLLLIQVVFAGSFRFLAANLFLVPAITIYSVLQVTVDGLAILALSSLSKSSRFVGVMYAGLMFFTAALFQALRGITGSTAFAWMSPGAALEQLGDVVFRLSPRYDLPPAIAGLTVIGLIAGSMVVLARRVKGVEIVT